MRVIYGALFGTFGLVSIFLCLRAIKTEQPAADVERSGAYIKGGV